MVTAPTKAATSCRGCHRGRVDARVLARLFPNAPTDTEPWSTLLWATGRGELPGHERLATWRWNGTVR